MLIKWQGLPPHEATREDYEKLQQLFPEFYLEDKVILERECNGRPLIIQQYSRKKKKEKITGERTCEAEEL